MPETINKEAPPRDPPAGTVALRELGDKVPATRSVGIADLDPPVLLGAWPSPLLAQVGERRGEQAERIDQLQLRGMRQLDCALDGPKI
jgi:hypothetical protein